MIENDSGTNKKEPSCAHPGCDKKGAYRAPLSRQGSGYTYFCLEHIRAYNAAWDYFAGLSAQEIEAEIRKASLWERPTWPFSSEETRKKAAPYAAEKRKRVLPVPVQKALQKLGVSERAAWPEIRSAYRTQVKLYHPDARGGQKDSTEKFIAVQNAFSVLKAYYAKSEQKKSA